MRKLASICKIESIEKIDGSDFLSVAKLEGKCWNIVVKNDEFKAGDVVVYFEIDSAIPASDARFEWLRERCYKNVNGVEVFRIKTVKLRGVVSQGLISGIKEFDELNGCSVGDDVTDKLGVINYNSLIEDLNHGETEAAFPAFIPKTDEERLQNLEEYFTNESIRNMEFEATEKYDGMSTTFYVSGGEFNVCSRNCRRKRDSSCAFWEIAERYDIEKKLFGYFKETGDELAIQGELVGPGSNGNRDKYLKTDFYVFRIWNITKGRFEEAENRVELCKKFGLNHVKILGKGKFFLRLKDMDGFLAYVRGKTDRGNEREGIVFKNKTGVVSFKVINNQYLLKDKE